MTEKKKEYQKAYYERMKKDPEWAEKRKEKTKEYWRTMKERNPKQYEKHLQRQREINEVKRDLYKKFKEEDNN